MVTQAGIHTLELIEDRDFSIVRNSQGEILYNSIEATGTWYILTNNDNYVAYSDDIEEGENNVVINDYKFTMQLNGLTSANATIIEQIEQSIYGFIPVITLMNNYKYTILTPFFQKVGTMNTQQSNTYNIDVAPRISTLSNLILTV